MIGVLTLARLLGNSAVSSTPAARADGITPDDIATARRQFSRRGAGFAAAGGELWRLLSPRLIERLDPIRLEPARVLDLGARDPRQLALLGERFPGAEIVPIDLVRQVAIDPFGVESPGVESPLARLARRFRRQPRRSLPTLDTWEQLPFDDASFDLVISHLLVPYCDAPDALFREVFRILRPDGAFFLTALGPDTLKEYRGIWQGIDDHEHVFGLADLHDLGDAMLKAGFADPVLDRQDLQIRHADIAALQHELRGLGAGNIARGRRRGLIARSVPDTLDALARDDRPFISTLELLQGHGWKSTVAKSVDSTGQEFHFPVSALAQSRRQT